MGVYGLLVWLVAGEQRVRLPVSHELSGVSRPKLGQRSVCPGIVPFNQNPTFLLPLDWLRTHVAASQLNMQVAVVFGGKAFKHRIVRGFILLLHSSLAVRHGAI